jgi:hypothetical protein
VSREAVREALLDRYRELGPLVWEKERSVELRITLPAGLLAAKEVLEAELKEFCIEFSDWEQDEVYGAIPVSDPATWASPTGVNTLVSLEGDEAVIQIELEARISDDPLREGVFVAALDEFCHAYALTISPKLPDEVGRSTLERRVGDVVSRYFDKREPRKP